MSVDGSRFRIQALITLSCKAMRMIRSIICAGITKGSMTSTGASLCSGIVMSRMGRIL